MAITQVLSFLHLFRIEWLYLIVGLIIFAATYLVRRFAPSLWVLVTSKYPALALLPMLVIGALLSSKPTSGAAVWDIVQDTLLKSVLGVLTALGLHAAAKALPIPYNGAEKQVAAASVRRATAPGGHPPVDIAPKP